MLDIFDVAALAGLAMLFAGLWLVSPAVALSVVGAGLMLWALVAAGRAARGDVDEGAA